MSKVGNRAILIPSGVTVTIVDKTVSVKGPKGELTVELLSGITLEQVDNTLVVKRTNNEKTTMSFHGLIRSLLQNAIIGVSEGYSKTLEINGVGFRAELKDKEIVLHLGLSHPVPLDIVEGVSIQQDKNRLMLSGIDKQRVGHMAALIRSYKKPEPYKGKGIKYLDEVIKRKAGKAAKTGG